MDARGTARHLPLGGRALTRRGLLAGSAAAALALAGCGGAADRPWEREPGSTEGLWGLARADTGEWALAPTFRSPPWFVGPDSLGAREGGPDSLAGVADASTGEWVVAPRFRGVGRFSDGLAAAQSDA